MKKRLISMLLSLCLVAALFSGLGVTAYADVDTSTDTKEGYVVAYTVVSGDTMAKICASFGVAYDANVTKCNPGANLANLRVGQVVYIPVSSVSSTDTYYTVYKHIATKGDTHFKVAIAYNTRCSEAMYLAWNDTSKVVSIGDAMYIPVKTTYIAPAAPTSTVSPAEPTASVPTTTPTDAPTPAPTTTPAGTETPAPTTAPSDSTPVVNNVVGYMIQYTVQARDTLNKVCTSLGSNYYTYKNVIVAVNGLSSADSIRVGQKLWLPSNTVPDTSVDYYTIHSHVVQAGDTAVKIAQSFGVATNDPWIPVFNGNKNLNKIYPGDVVIIPEKNGKIVSVAPSTPGSTPSGNSGSATGTAATPATTPVADTVAFYLASHKMEKGETVNSVCNKLGVRFGNYSAMIQRLNNITSWTSIPIGKVLLIPSASAPAEGGYKIIAHTVVAGDTVNKLCAGYGYSYSANSNTIKALNTNVPNLNSIRVGQVLYFPVPVGSTVGNVTRETVNTTVPVATYPQGKIITLTVREKAGYTFESLKVVDTANKEVPVTKTADGKFTFTMPATDVVVSVVYIKNS